MFCASTVLSLKETSDMVNCEDFGSNNKKLFSACFVRVMEINSQYLLVCLLACVFCILSVY